MSAKRTPEPQATLERMLKSQVIGTEAKKVMIQCRMKIQAGKRKRIQERKAGRRKVEVPQGIAYRIAILLPGPVGPDTRSSCQG